MPDCASQYAQYLAARIVPGIHNAPLISQDHQMTGKQRIALAVAHKPSDVVPYDPYVSPGHALHLMGHQNHEMFTVPGLLTTAMINATRTYHSDICYCRTGSYIGHRFDIRQDEKEVVFISKETHKPQYRALKDLHSLIPIDPPPPKIIENISDVDTMMPITPASELIQSPMADEIRQYRAELGDDTCLFGCAAGVTMKTLKNHRGFEQGLMDLYTNTDLAHAIMQRRQEQLHEYVLAFAQLGLDAYYTGDAEASCSVVSPEIFRSMFKPYYTRHIADIKAHGLIALLHICGKSSLILDDIRDIAPDIFESLDPPSLGGDIDLADAKKRIGDTVCLKGNLDALGMIEKGPAEKVYAESLNLCSIAAPGSGYILSTEQITPNTPKKHVLAMEQARRDYQHSSAT